MSSCRESCRDKRRHTRGDPFQGNFSRRSGQKAGKRMSRSLSPLRASVTGSAKRVRGSELRQGLVNGREDDTKSGASAASQLTATQGTGPPARRRGSRACARRSDQQGAWPAYAIVLISRNHGRLRAGARGCRWGWRQRERRRLSSDAGTVHDAVSPAGPGSPRPGC